jgi:hypothetical protein
VLIEVMCLKLLVDVGSAETFCDLGTFLELEASQ